MAAIEVTGLSYYPIKSCGPVEAEEVVVTDRGMQYDREWMLVGSKDQMITQRTNPELARVATSIEDGSLVVRVRGFGRIAVSLDREDYDDEREIPVEVFKKPGVGIEQGAETAEFFSDYVGKPVRLLRITQPRGMNPKNRVADAAERIGFADGYPLLLASERSLGELNSYMDREVGIDRFRANIVVSGGVLGAYEEDYWRELRIGSLQAFVVKACARCPVPNVDQQSGTLSRAREVTAALRQTRRGVSVVDGSTGEFFGQNMTYSLGGSMTVRLGDTVSIISKSHEPNVILTDRLAA